MRGSCRPKAKIEHAEINLTGSGIRLLLGYRLTVAVTWIREKDIT